jgi:phenylacetate-CoA ligase
MRVVILARRYQADQPHRVFVEVEKLLADAGVELVVSNSWLDSHAEADLLIAIEPILDRAALANARLLGQRTLNRFQRMESAARANVAVAAFGSPRNDDELSALARPWDDGAVLKYDWSSRRNGVFLWPLRDDRQAFPADFTPGQDLFMEFLPGDPLTYKIDAFGGTILGSWILPTRSMELADWQLMDGAKLREFDVPAPLQHSISAFSEKLLEKGVGYASFDLMRAADGFRLIEANTCASSTAAWNLDPARYASGLAAAIVATLKHIEAVPEFGQLRLQAQFARNDESAVALISAAAPKNPAGTGRASSEQLFYNSLSASERLPPDRMTKYNQKNIEMLLRHAFQTVPFYRERLACMFSWRGIEWERWPDITLTTRDDVRRQRHALLSRKLPAAHGSTTLERTSGSTGEPVTVTCSAMHMGGQHCMEARLYQWHGVHTGEAMATLWPLPPVPEGRTRTWAPRWLRPPHGIDHYGDLGASPEQQLHWLRSLGPVYLRTRPSLARLLALTVAANPELRPNLKAIVTEGEAVTLDHRRLCRKYLGHDLIDVYRLTETGLAALWCPVAEVYHVPSETCVVEVLDRDGKPCAPGQIGEIVVTPLYNFAMPLLRYATGDLAEVAAPTEPNKACACGRTLPTIKRILGRKRSVFRSPDGRLVQPDVDSRILLDHLGTRLWQLTQVSARDLELHYVAGRSADREDRDAAARHISAVVSFAADIRFHRVQSLPVSVSGQREDFVCAPSVPQDERVSALATAPAS